ncbi:hypothetical protein FDB24_11370 [Clostridium botulinum]|uniref:hypothetical protein n=1 Tax=Clostridium botulinum TaxID=1491 RepID=UPI0007737543|nr:hypothetical protein [Clostridium botulinum]NFL86826.1 hypothetical protein [Clostridium botulinum]NFO21852.1 hypothetical protein [Clostridium botulinum]
MIINLEDIRRKKEFKERYRLRKPMIQIMCEYERKYGLSNLKKDFEGLFSVMQERAKYNNC